jgi:uncharacterized membrane protein
MRLSLGSRRAAIAGLSLLGLVDSLYMLAFTEGLSRSLACPFFGRGCEIVGRSPQARHLGVPNAAVGALGYAAMASLAVWSGRRRGGWQPRLLATVALAATGASAWLTWEQKTTVRAWCFWCLSSTAINAALLPLAVSQL